MKTPICAFLLAMGSLVANVHAQDAPKQPGPEHKRLEPWAGKWKFEEVILDSPLGKAGTNTGTLDSRMILDGFFLETTTRGVGPEGPIASVEILAWDPDKSHYQDSWFTSNGEFDRAWKMENAIATVQGDNTWNWSWKQDEKGVTYSCKQTVVMAADQKSFAWEDAYSENGNSWKKRRQGKAQRQGEDSRNRPSAEHKKLAMGAGDWTYEEEHGLSPFGPAGKATFASQARMILNGFFLEERGKGMGPEYPYSWVATTAYDPEKGYFGFAFDTDGASSRPWKGEVATMTINGNTWTSNWNQEVKGKTYQVRAVTTYSADGKSVTYEWSYSEDGSSWKTWLTGVGTKS